MPKPLTRAQQLENAAFLRHLRRTGNVCAAARALGFGRGRFIERRRKHPAFALQWDAALTLAHAAFAEARDASPPRPGWPASPISAVPTPAACNCAAVSGAWSITRAGSASWRH